VSVEPDLRIEPTEIDVIAIKKLGTISAQIVVLPNARSEGLGIYNHSSMMMVKRLRAAGVDAVYLDAPESRTFEVKKGASLLFTSMISVGLGIGSSAAWDAVKTFFRSRSAKSADKLSITYLDVSGNEGHGRLGWKVEGNSEAVLKAIDKLREKESANLVETLIAPARDSEMAESFPEAGADDDLIEASRREQVEDLRKSAQSLLQDAREAAERECNTDSWQSAEREARAALAIFARSLDWAEDSADENEAHRLMDDAGYWVRQTFGCQLSRSGAEYRQRCPVTLAHNRIGMSIGGTAKRLCSLCGVDLSECEHIPGKSYLVPGGASPLGWCRVCLKESCDHLANQTYRAGVVGMLKDIEIREVSLVPKPAQPEARILEMSVPVSELKNILGERFTAGDDVSCDACLFECDGLTKHDPSNFIALAPRDDGEASSP
jgi:hypothetical protein